ncbi:MAG: hypothetical protein PVG51_15705 [Desulfosarcina sp.]
MVGILVLNATFVAGGDGHHAFALSCFQEACHSIGGLAGAGTTIDAAYQTSGSAKVPSGERLRFLSPVETEPSDLEPLKPKHNKLSSPTLLHRALIPIAAAGLIGATVPLYLAYQSIIC